jgi:hypothetical protein
MNTKTTLNGSALRREYAADRIRRHNALSRHDDPLRAVAGIEPAATALFERIKVGELHAYTSVLTFDELAYRLLLALIRDRYSGSPLDCLRDQKVQMITELYPKIAPALARLRAFALPRLP